jgi:hypothetical protein
LRDAVAAILLALAVAGCGGVSRSPETQLTMTGVNTWVGRAVFHLECGPPGGDLPRPARACSALRKDPALITDPQPFNCIGGFSSWWSVAITGRLNGRPFSGGFATCWTPQMPTLGRFGMSWDVLRKHLVNPRTGVVLPGTRRRFGPGELRTADFITCDIHSHHLKLGVPPPTPRDQSSSVGWGGANVVSVELRATHHPDGSVTAVCHRVSD